MSRAVVPPTLPVQRVGLATHPGLREQNEDSLCALDRPSPGLLAMVAVADGMGGFSNGATAARIATDLFARGGIDPSPDGLRDAVLRVNDAILSYARSISAQVGTTLTAAAVQQGVARIAHVGDSRAYLVHSGVAYRVTNDHSLVGELVRDGKLSAEEAQLHEQRNVLQRAVGVTQDLDVDIYEVGIGPGDVLILCSDGLHTMVTDQEIAGAVIRFPSMTEAAEQLVGLAAARGGDDNITAVAWRYPETSSAQAWGTLTGRAARRVRPPASVVALRVALLITAGVFGFLVGSVAGGLL